MHRHAVRDISSGFQHSFRRWKTGNSQPARSGWRPAQAQRRDKGKFQVQDDDSYDYPLSEELKKVISPEACGWLEGKPTHKGSRGDWKDSDAPLKTLQQSLSPSAEKVMFDSLDTSEHPDMVVLPGGDDADVMTGQSTHIPAGSLVEIRRSEMAVNAIVLFSVLIGRRWMVYSLASNGEVWQHHEHDVTFQIPDFVTKQMAKHCGLGLIAKTEGEMAARVDILKKLRSFEKNLEYHSHVVPGMARAQSFYDRVAHPDGNTWVNITTRKAAETLFGTPSLSTQELFATQSYLFSSGIYFVAESRRFLLTPSFWVRPRQEVADIEAVTAMVLHRNPALNSFVENARKLITESRQRVAESWNEPPSRRPLSDLEWSEQDRTILRFLVASMQNRRLTQHDPFLIPIAHILKATKLYSLAEYETAAAHTFLLEMGVMAPWEELNTREGVQREEPSRVDLTPTASTPIIPSSLGPDDMYPHDIVDSLRHDFGELPVYVVDDWGAEELDDGISVERIPGDPEHAWLHVHVADPTVLLPPTHNIARRAMEISSARYHVDRTIPMLPREAGFHRFSLGNTPGQADPTLTFSCKVDSAGDIVDYKIQPGLVRNVHTIKYDEVDAVLGIPPLTITYPFGRPDTPRVPTNTSVIDPAMIEDLQLLRQVTRNMNNSRFRRGSLVFAFPQPEVIIEPRPLPRELMGSLEPAIFRGFPQMTYAVGTTLEQGARNIVAECMKAAGRAASLFFRDRDIPALRRTVGPLTSELRGAVENVMAQRAEGGIVDVFTALRERISAPSGTYSTRPEMHSLLGIPDGEGYMKVTSPLRRFGDLLTHWQIKHALLAERGERVSPVLFSEEWLREMSDDMAMRELYVKRTESIQQTFWAHSFLLRWMKDPAREKREHDPLRSLKASATEVPAMNMRTTETVCQVHIPALALNGRVRNWNPDRKHVLGDEVDVEIATVSLGTRPSLDLKLR